MGIYSKRSKFDIGSNFQNKMCVVVFFAKEEKYQARFPGDGNVPLIAYFFRNDCVIFCFHFTVVMCRKWQTGVNQLISILAMNRRKSCKKHDGLKKERKCLVTEKRDIHDD